MFSYNLDPFSQDFSNNQDRVFFNFFEKKSSHRSLSAAERDDICALGHLARPLAMSDSVFDQAAPFAHDAGAGFIFDAVEIVTGGAGF